MVDELVFRLTNRSYLDQTRSNLNDSLGDKRSGVSPQTIHKGSASQACSCFATFKVPQFHYYWVLPSFTRFYRVRLSFLGHLMHSTLSRDNR